MRMAHSLLMLYQLSFHFMASFLSLIISFKVFFVVFFTFFFDRFLKHLTFSMCFLVSSWRLSDFHKEGQPNDLSAPLSVI